MSLINLFCVIILITNSVICYVPHNRPYGIVPYTPKGLNVPSIIDTSPPFHNKHNGEMEADSDEEMFPDPLSESTEKAHFLDTADDAPVVSNENDINSIDYLRERIEKIKEEEDIDIKSNLLMKLMQELPEGPLPVVYIEDASASGSAGDGTEFTSNSNKRSGRYYRRYPWKRQNSRNRTYDADARYLCVPSREDVFKLLVGLHENRNGNQQKTINFCNRKRPAKAIFTNIRFLG